MLIDFTMKPTSETNFVGCLRELCGHSDVFRATFGQYLPYKSFTQSDMEDIMTTLSEFLLTPNYTVAIARCVPHVVLELLVLGEHRGRDSTLKLEDKNLHHKKLCVALGKLVNFHPDATRFALQYFENNPSPFQDMMTTHFLVPSSAKKRKLSLQKTSDSLLVTDLEIVESCFNFLQVAGNYFRQRWEWSEFIKLYVGHSEDFICWLACQCAADVTAMTDTQRQAVLNTYLSPESIRACTIRFDSTGFKEDALKNKSVSDDSVCHVSKAVVSVCGIQLPVFNSTSQDIRGCLIPVNSTLGNLKSLALAVASGRAVCLQGPVGSGKTSVVEHLALLTGRNSAPHFMKVQLGDQTDSKMLLGSYRCTDVPGEFVWQPGVLTQAVVGGHWILLEDVDSAAADVASVLASLVETGTLSVPGYRDCIRVAPGFQLIVTQRLLPSLSGFHSQLLGAASFLEEHWVQINTEPLSRQELVQLVEVMFPLLKTVVSRIVDVFLLFSVGNHSSSLHCDPEVDEEVRESHVQDVGVAVAGRRLTSTRDLIKWCTRSVQGFDVTSQDSALKIFQDAIDIFCCSVTNADTKLKLATRIGACLGIVKTKADYFCNSYKPAVKITTSSFVAGRVSLPRNVKTVTMLDSATSGSSFSFTRPAACLLERVACCVVWKEPVLLVGETGTGKTSTVQYLADKTGHRLVVINMNQQSDSADLLGGYKPVDLKYIVGPVREEFETLFRSYFSLQKNVKFLEHIGTCFNLRHWSTLLKLMKHSHSAAMKRLIAEDSPAQKGDADRRLAWQGLGLKLLKLESQLKAPSALAFSFMEGSLVRALREGHWVLLDEINLASAETLECLSGLLEGSTGSVFLLERGDQKPIERHPDFQLFACMNPATDVGKKDLPAGLRNRFTEFFVDELTEKSDLMLLVGTYLRDLSLPTVKLENIVKFYLSIRKEAAVRLTDGTGHKPHYSLRTLCRALSVASLNRCGSVLRSLYEGLCLSFLTQLDYASHPVVQQMVAKAVVGSADIKSVLKQPIPPPNTTDPDQCICFEGYWIPRGNDEPNVDTKYILTPSVRRNLCDLVRIVSIGRHPVLLQGETSVGKTSLITYLAKASGNLCVRINNHEHTDLQEYIGSYCADEHGRLVFREGVLVEAMRQGHWIILDELNLAPTDVLEALNRVLDDNRELFIPETQETVRAHPHFMLFATQNPPGVYGGRKMLSRAFRNRFVELHFDEIPAPELEIILHKRCDMPLSYCKKMVSVMTDLQLRRRGSAAFAGKQGFITLRDLFRWGERYRLAGEKEGTFYDWDQHIADEGYLVLAGRVRKQEECHVIQDVIKRHINRTVDPQRLFTLSPETSSVTRFILEDVLMNPLPGFEHVVWTYTMRRLAVLVGKACQFKEPVLLVGETGCGKTSVCQMLAAIHRQSLFTVNCHMHTESSDFLGGLRPVREHTSNVEPARLFEWVDGPLIEAMHKGDLFLADEISLADDSVLERLNSLLEPERKLLLAEKGGGEMGTEKSCIVTANKNFHFIGTMNPGGDYGKKELSPALRNRFTEIWCESCTDRKDLLAIVEHNLKPGFSQTGVGGRLLDFIGWFTSTDIGKRFTVSVRDILSWVNFINACTKDEHSEDEAHGSKKLDLAAAYIHGACLTFLDSFGSGITSVDSTTSLGVLHTEALKYLTEQMGMSTDEISSSRSVVSTDTHFGIPPFYIRKGTAPVIADNFTFLAPTTSLNVSRVLRGLQLNKPILLEGSPGVGKTSLVMALAKAAGYHVTRINVSDQTDASDLFGADLPMEGGDSGQFAWRDGPFLQALKAGHWILLDELNLASQSVLEGLNACLDHRGEVFIPELGKTFYIQTDSTRLFGAQNPLRQGGARRGLPQSFLNRFTQVYIDSLTEADLEFIITSLFPALPHNLISCMVKFNSRLVRETGELRLWGQRGAPWELNLRDLCRWCEATMADSGKCTASDKNVTFHPGKFVDLIYVGRMRTKEDKEKVKEIYIQEIGSEYPLLCDFPRIHITHSTLFIDDIFMSRNGMTPQRTGMKEEVNDSAVQLVTGLNEGVCQEQDSLLLLRRQFHVLRSLARCVDMNYLAILVGSAGSGKTSAVHLLSQLLGQELRVLSINSAMDTTEILGGFEQADYSRHLEEIATCTERHLLAAVRRRLMTKGSCGLLAKWEKFRQLADHDVQQQTLVTESELFRHQLTALQEIVTALLTDSQGQQFGGQTRLAELRNLESKLNILAQNVAKEGSLNAGGKFEWIDSVLVKCLQDGCWLVVDNVNLCSPAVLDRLNALLEPGGSLTIGERGVGPDGQLVTVCPHPGFRLFLTMDPHNGEISRAMRNRGVEIYLLGPQEEEYNSLDLRSLLYHAGLRSESQQDALLSVHQAMKQGVSEPTISQMLHAALLISRQISLGQSHYEAFVSSCCDVYIKSCVRNVSGSSGCSDVKQKLYQLLTQTLDSSLFIQGTCNSQLDDKFSMDVFTLMTPKLRRNASYVVLKQQGAVLETLLEALVSSELECSEELMETGDINHVPYTQSLNRLLDIYDGNIIGTKVATVVKVTDVIPCFLLMFYATATRSDVELRHEWLLELIAKCKRKSQGATVILKKYQLMTEILKRTLCQAFSSSLNSHKSIVQSVCSVIDLPWDIRWLPDIAAFCEPKCCACGAVNKLSLLLWFTVQKMQTEVLAGEMHPGKRKSLTVMEYSAALMRGTLTDDITSHCVITKFAPLIHQFDDCLEAALKSVKTLLDDDQCSSLQDALGWRLRLSQLGNLQLVNSDGKKQGRKTRNLIEGAVSTLSVHYRWLAKWTVPKLQSVMDLDEALRNSKLVMQLEHTMKMIDASLAVSSSALLPVGKQVKQLMCHAVPHGSKKHAELWEQIQRLSALLCVWADSNSVHHAKSMAVVGFLRTHTGMKSRLDLVHAYQHLIRDENIDQVICIVKQVEELCQEFGVTCRSPDFVSKADSHLHSNSEVQIWPVQELMCVVLGGALKRALCQQNENLASSHHRLSCKDIAKNLQSIMLPLPSIPPMLVAMITLLTESNELVTDPTSDVVRNLIPKLTMMILKHSELSPSVRQLEDWLSWKQEASNVENGEREMQMDWTASEANREDSFPLHCPVMTNIVTSFVLPNCQSSNSNATVGSHISYKRQLSVLKQILWRNMKVLSAPELDYRLNDALCVQSLFQRFVHTLSLALGHSEDEAPDKGYSNDVERVIQTLQGCSSPQGKYADSVNDKQKQFSDALIHLTETVARLKGSISMATNCQADVNRNDVSDFQLLVSTAEAWILLGFLQVTLYADLGLIDPVAKKKLKLQYVSEEQEETERMLYAQELQSHVCSAGLNAFDDCHLHPHIVALRERLKHLTVRQHKLEKCVAVRPEPPLFDSLAKEALHYSNTLASAEVVLNIQRCIVDAVHKLHVKSYSDEEKMVLIKRAEEVLREEHMWRESQLRFCDKLSRLYCSWYPDMVVPLLCAATQLCYGMHQLATLLQKEVVQTKVSLGHVGCEGINLNKLMRDLVRFPYVGEGQSCVVSLVDSWTSDVTVDVLKKVVTDQTDTQQCRKETFCLFKSSLEELKNLVMIRGELQDEVWIKMTHLLEVVVMLWRQQEDGRKHREEEEQSLYITKSRTLSDEDQDALALAEMFPSSDANDFGDLQQQATLHQVPVAQKAPGVSVVDVLTVKDMDFICQLHSHVMQSYTRCAWLSPVLSSVKFSHLTPDFIPPLLQRYRIFGLLLEKMSRGLDSSLDSSLYPSLTLLTACTLSYVDKGRTKLSDVGDLSLAGSPSRQGKFLVTAPKMKVFDFYRDGFVEEVKQCFPILMAVTVRVKELVAEWPDHPTLKQMLVIMERICKFPLTSPVSRFLTGFEILLDKIHEWEENAHSGVSLAPYWKSVTDQIGRWRKLELQCWKDSLDNVASGIEAAASKWWFYIYSVVESFTKDRVTESSAEELIKTFQKFMEQSTLGEYGTRLNVLFTFHCHVVHMPKTACRDELMNVLWNVYHYYSQFSEAVAARIRNLRSPIEKKLKDCVKIFRWDDISHWAIREATTRIHKTLHKHIKQFKEVLSQPVTECLTNPASETGDVNLGMWDRPQRHQPRSYQSLLEPLHFIADTRLKKLTAELDDDMEGTLFSRSGSLFMKARKLCRETILNTPYAKSVQTVEGLITVIIETSNHLKNLEVSADLPKSKQKSQAKSFLQQKRKALADLFRALQEIGLSYRTGLVYWNAGEVGTHEFTLPPVDLHAAFQHLKSRRIDGPLLSLWDGCESYFVRSVARLALLNASLQNPSKDLGPPAIERFRGFAVHLMVVSRKQKLLLSESCQLLCSLRSQVAQLAAIEDAAVTLPRQSELQTWLGRLKALLTTCIICFEQFRILLYCCPYSDEQDISSDIEMPILEFTEGLELPAIVQSTKGDHAWSTAVEKVRSLVSSAVKLKYAIEKSETVPPCLYGTKVVNADLRTHSSVLMSCAQFEVLVNAYNEIEEYMKGVDMLKAVCELQHKAKGQETEPQVPEESQANRDRNPMIDSLIWLQQYILAETAEFSLFAKNGGSTSEHCPVQQDAAVKHFRDDTEKFLKSILIAIQNVYKFNGKNDKPDENTEQDDVKQSKDVESNDKESESELQLVETVELLSSSLSMFNVSQVNEELHGLVQRLAAILDTQKVTEGNICRRLLLHCLPCLDQLLLFYQFFVTHQVASYRVSCKLLSVLLAVFIELAQKGFCIPPELAPSEEGCQSDSTAGGMGLGEGEGEKDVSEQIESEEQLEDARPKGEENTEDHKDCKEEEKGIEMSADFEGKVQDMEKKEDEEGNSDEEEDNEEEPDKEMGETDAGAERLDQQIWGSDSEDEAVENKEEERGTGEKIGEPELAANEEDTKPGEESDGQETGKQEPKRKEINEMDDADENDDQIDPYHGQLEPHPEPEPLDLPEDLQLDGGENKDGGDEEGQEENPFDIDKMKEHNVSEENEKDDNTVEDELPEGNKQMDEEMEGEDGDKEEETEETEKSDLADAEGGGSKDEEKTGDDPKVESEKEVEEESAKPSEDHPADIPAEAAAEMDQAYGSKDEVVSDKERDKSAVELQPADVNGEEGRDTEQGVGQAQAKKTETGHHGDATASKDIVQTGDSQTEENKNRRQRLQESDSNRSLGEVSEPVNKKRKTMNTAMEEDGEELDEGETEEGGNADIYQHIKEAKKKFDTQTLDAATEEQAQKQPVPNLEDEDGEEPKEDDSVELQGDSVPVEDEIPTKNSEKVSNDKKQSNDKNERMSGERVDEGGDTEMCVEVDGDKVETLGAARGSETTFHTALGDVASDATQLELMSAEDYHTMRSQLESQLAAWSQPPPNEEAERAWEMFSAVTSGLARDLSEQLRLVLEPTRASRLRGDYRTGRRINMRKVIPYIASQFRKDKIWLRRTKPCKREYQIMLAVDDSSSMADNHSKELAFESLALVSQALTLLEAGELAVISFGETPRVLHQLGDPFTEKSGARLLQQFSFEQKNTRVGQLVDFATTMFTTNCSRSSSSSEQAQLLIIVSDGRVMSEGPDRVKQAVRRARHSGIFMVFVIVDNPESKDSILDIQQPLFSGAKCVGFSSYLDSFPFPFYLILRDINALPSVLSDALRQWFELVAGMDK